MSSIIKKKRLGRGDKLEKVAKDSERLKDRHELGCNWVRATLRIRRTPMVKSSNICMSEKKVLYTKTKILWCIFLTMAHTVGMTTNVHHHRIGRTIRFVKKGGR